MNFILLATYNGARFLPQLIESVRAQTESDWRMLVRDDGSSDATLDVIRAAAAQDRRITLCELGSRQGVARNFEHLMHAALGQGAKYLFFADQDDVWQPTKLEVLIAAMRRQEDASETDVPILAHCDLTVVDEQLRPLKPSFMRAIPVLGPKCQFPGFLLYNNITGCATLINRRLAETALPFPSEVLIHDWWVALIATCAGHVVYVDQQLVLYRNHGANAVGAVTMLEKILPWRAGWRGRFHRARSNFAGGIGQAFALCERLMEIDSEIVLPSRLAVVARFCEIFRRPSSAAARYRALRNLGVPRINLATGLVLFLRLMLYGRQPATPRQHTAIARENAITVGSLNQWRHDAARPASRPKSIAQQESFLSGKSESHPRDGVTR